MGKKITVALIVVIVAIGAFIGIKLVCNDTAVPDESGAVTSTSTDVSSDTLENLYTDAAEPEIYVESVYANAGDTAYVDLKIKNNPGVAGAKIKIDYDERLSLTDTSLGEAFSELDFTMPPLSNPCYFNWDSLYQESYSDGVILTMVFAVPKDASAGETFEVSCSYSDGDIYDVNLEDLYLTAASGTITVK